MRFPFSKLLILTVFILSAGACGPSSAPKIVSSSNAPPLEREPDKLPSQQQPQRNLPPDVVTGKAYGWHLQDGKKQTLADHKGKVVILDFWATYCPPCLEEIPHLVNLQKKHQNDGLQVVGLHVGGPDDKPFVAGFVERLKIQYDLGEPQPELVDALFAGSDDIPQTFVFDRNGKLVGNFSGYSVAIREELDSTIAQALAN